MARPRIAVIGSANTDMVVQCARIPMPGETVLGGTFSMVRGGKGANQAVAAARLGADVAFIGCVGGDTFGQEALAALDSEGIDTTHCARSSQASSGVALISVNDDGQNAIVVAPGANMDLSEDHVRDALPMIAQADVWVLQCEIPMRTVAFAVRQAQEMGKRVILNPAPACELPREVLTAVDVLTPNETEVAALAEPWRRTPGSPEADAETLLRIGVRCLVVTLGSAGALIGFTDNGRTSFVPMPAFGVAAVDATGAGDCFTAALAVALAERWLDDLTTPALSSVGVAARFASAAAAVSVMKLGAQPSLPRRADVDAFLASHR